MSETSPAASGTKSLMPSAQERAKLRNTRRLKDSISKWGITTAGLAVVAALGLIFFYLFSEVFPLLKDAEVEVVDSYPVAQVSSAENQYMLLERYEQIGASLTSAGTVEFFEADYGKPLVNYAVDLPAGVEMTALGKSTPNNGLIALGLSNGELLLSQISYGLTYPDDKRKITPELDYPLGETPIVMDPEGKALRAVAVQATGRGHVLAAITEDNRIQLGVYTSRKNMITGKITSNGRVFTMPGLPGDAKAQFVQVDQTARHLVVADDQAQLHTFAVDTPSNASLTESVPTGRGQVTAMEFLVGTGSLVIGTDSGSVSQWLLVRDPKNVYHVKPVRDFEGLPNAITTVSPEYTRRGFLVGDSEGYLGIYHGTAARTLLVEQVAEAGIAQLAISPINGKLLILDQAGTVQVTEVWNEHPEISFSSLWQKVWYEGRSEPEYVWQASSGGDESESKMSLVPLSLGTLKAAFFAMLFAIPLGIMGAVYTAYFMTPKMRGLVKPTIEIMEALPTVILGFLAGLWLAPFLENHLPAIFSILLLMPVMMVLVGFGWSHLPGAIRHRVSDGWEAAILIIPVLLTGWLCVAVSPHLEIWFFDGSMRQWFTNNGINYDQRNALVVGIAMGFAVIPTIFSIAEDAVFNVPRHLTQGSLALGATRWQTVIGVVLPTASPGIFSAVMMGFGRAVGETMIVLMATGNSPVVNFNIFEGMRTLSANVAVELPETAVDSTHFRVLFLASLVLLALTFIVNTCAEIIRQRLRKRYSNL
ncbi:ABC transporter permease subunit [Gilvimarinus sp. SDUM040013]|uniref:ABC transporter permease subunit n=1 Tax=Gilvimarinus gilvus TaxID=3058038 RepID=A0ABU4RSL8_9GAMM|nr:ABC transporter permease subunit [Gilvimarinus sp. SDUM040013]MDO3388325.1 ABC transporter permease subunit [Gilvimarinus sp. SDUM040013]MDX6847875.1 ABC transporter permease subunit [Gilvimarinus sp. SDUM040013]